MLIISEKVGIDKIKKIAHDTFEDLVKAVVDIEKGIIALGAELHSDEEAALIEQGSEQKNLWGINIYPDADEESFIEFDSMINLRPSQGNRTRGVDNPAIRERIIAVVNKLIVR